MKVMIYKSGKAAVIEGGMENNVGIEYPGDEIEDIFYVDASKEKELKQALKDNNKNKIKKLK